jgi:eight-cysteine-cluster-containing protein
MIFRVLILAFFLGVPVVNTAATDVESSFYTIRRDLRRCASPMCGGYFIKLVNQPRTRCANGRTMNECYVASIEWNGQPETDKDGALVRGSLSTRGDRRGKFGVLNAREVWLPAGDKQSSGTFFRVRDRGIRCIAAPCETHHQAKLNTSVRRNIAGVDLSGAGAPENAVGDANQAMTSPEGVIVAGVNSRVTGPAGRSQMLKGSQFYLHAKPGGGTSSGNDNQNKPCFKTGCSGQVCADEEVITTCEYRTEYDCYKTAKCERQANGKCGFTDTPELRRCLRRN